MRTTFTLIELALTTAILCTLTALAIPMVADAHVRAAFGEAPLNANAIADGAVLMGASGMTLDLALHPRGDTSSLGRGLRPFLPAPEPWSELGWEPDGMVRCDYAAVANDAWGSGLAWCDVDDDDWCRIYQDTHFLDPLAASGEDASEIETQDLCYPCGTGAKCVRGSPGCSCSG